MRDPLWEEWYAAGNDITGSYPAFYKLISTHVVQADRVLELGAGLGANIDFLRGKYRCEYNGMDGSASAVKRLHDKFPDLASRIRCDDFCSTIPFDAGFDAVVDRASIPHNSLAEIRSCLALVWNALKPGGILVCSDWFSTSHSEFERGEPCDDVCTRTGYAEGQFREVGKVHFSSQRELESLFDKFEGVHMEENILRRPAPSYLVQQPIDFRFISRAFSGSEYRRATWDIVVRRPL